MNLRDRNECSLTGQVVEGRVRQGHALEVGHFKPEGEIWTFSYNREGSGMGFQAEGVTCLILYFREITLIGVWQKDGSVTLGWLRRGVRAVFSDHSWVTVWCFSRYSGCPSIC